MHPNDPNNPKVSILESMTDAHKRTVIDDWLRGESNASRAFIAFIDFAYDRFPEKMLAIAEEFVKTREGGEMFNEYLAETYEKEGK